MSDRFNPRVGAVLSADIAVPKHEREVRFYSRVLSTGEDPLWRQDLMNNLGMPVIGLGERVPEYGNLPLQWMPHIQVANIADSVQRATQLGGSTLMHEKDAEGHSQWAVLLDPEGAAFGIIPVVSREEVPNESAAAPDVATAAVGHICWLDLTVSHAPVIKDFYHGVVGWSVQEVEMSDGDEQYSDYNMLGQDGEPKAGICHARGPNAGLPPVWMIYLPVGDLTESLRRVEEEGGKVVNLIRGSDGESMYASVEDPVGVHFALVQG